MSHHALRHIRFVERDEDYSVYRRPDGETLCIAHGTAWTVLVDLCDLKVAFLWQQHLDGWVEGREAFPPAREAFLDALRCRLIDPDEADQVAWCERCDKPESEDDCTAVAGGGFVCERCSDYYYFCDRCEERYTNTTETLAGANVCDGCRDENYTFCGVCDGYYRDGNADEHDHPADDDDDDEERQCDCESPAFTFAVRNDGDPLLYNDTRVTVTLPAGVIDEEGMGRIYRYLRDQAMYEAANLSSEVGDKWQAKQGNYTKRLSRVVYNTHKVKIPPAVLSQIGCIAREHSSSVQFHIEVTRDLNMPASEFANDDSCWWQGYHRSRCALKSNGGYGLRSFTDSGYVNGRAWVMPLTNGQYGLTPTFDSETPVAFVVFNGYGDLAGYTAARIASHMAGMTYRKIAFACSPMFINGDSGYLVAPEEIATNYDGGGTLSLGLEAHSSLYETEKYSQKKVLAHV